MFHLVGITLVIFLVQTSLSMLGGQYEFYFDDVALLIVVGGTFTVAMISYPARECWEALRSLPNVARSAQENLVSDAQKIIQAATVSRLGQGYLKSIANDKETHEILRDGVDMIISGMTQDEIRDVMTERIYRERQRDEKKVMIFRNLSKYPPAFGLTGTVLGLINMMRGMSANASSSEVGMKMALALIATLYGLLLANFFLIPIAEQFSVKADLEKMRKELLLEGLLMIYERRSPMAVQEMMNSYLESDEKIDLLGLKGA